MHGRGRGRGFTGPNDIRQPGYQNTRVVQHANVSNPQRIVSMLSPPMRQPVASRLGWSNDSMPPQQPSAKTYQGSQAASYKMSKNNMAGPGLPPRNGQGLNIQPLGKFQGNNAALGWPPAPPAKQKPKPPINPLVKAAQDSFEQDQLDFTDDAAVSGFSNGTNSSSLNSYVMSLLHSIENQLPFIAGANNILEEGEYEEPQDFPSQLAQYQKDIEALYTYVPQNAVKASTSQSNVIQPSPDVVETTRNLKQALEEIRRRGSLGAQMSFPAASTKAEPAAPVAMPNSTGAISTKKLEIRSSPDQAIVSFDPKDGRLKVNKQEKHSPNKPQTETEWRREVRIVEREGRPPTRSDSGSRPHSPWRRQVRSPPIRRRSRSRSNGRRRSRTRSPPMRHGRSRTPPRWRRSRSPGRRVSRSPARRGIRSPARRVSRSPNRRVGRSPLPRNSPYRRMSRSPARRGRSRTPFNAVDRKVVVGRSRSPYRPPSPARTKRSPSPGAKFREGLVAFQNGTAPIQKPVVSQHFAQANTSTASAPTNAPGVANNTVQQPLPVQANFQPGFPPQPVHPIVAPHINSHPAFYGPSIPAAHVMLRPQLLHQQVLAQQIMQQQMIHRQQMEENLQQQLLQYQQLHQQESATVSPDPPVGTSTDENQNENRTTTSTSSSAESHSTTSSSDSSKPSSVSAQRDEVAQLEQRLRAQRDSKLEKQLNLMHQLLMLRSQQSELEQKQKVATTEVDRERLSLHIMEKAKLEKEMASSAQAMEKFILHATTQLGEDLAKLKEGKSEHLYRFYDPQLHWCELCDVICDKLHDYLNHLHSKKHEQMLESTGVPSMPWHDKQRPEDEKQAGKEGLIASRVPFGGLQSLQPVKAWYCKTCDEWMGDIHCATLHMTSTKHNSAHLRLSMERPDPGYLYAVRKQSAVKRNVARKKEEEKAKEAAKKRKMEELVEARKRRKPEESGEEKRKTSEEEQRNGVVEPAVGERNGTMQEETSTSGSVGTLTSETTETRSSGVQSEQTCSNRCEAENGDSHPSTEILRVSTVVRSESSVSNPLPEEASSQRLQEEPLDGAEDEVESLEKISAFVNAELRATPNLEAHNELPRDADKSSSSNVVSSSSGSRFHGQEHSLPNQEKQAPVSNDNAQHQEKPDSKKGAANANITGSPSIGSQQVNSGLPSDADENISPSGGEKTADSADCPTESSSQRDGRNVETLHSIPLQLLPPPLIPIHIKSEPEELRPVKTERGDFSEPVERPVALVKSEPVTSANQPENGPVGVGHSSEASNVVIKKESLVEPKVELPEEDEAVESRTEESDDSDDDCCIIGEVDANSGKVFDTVDLETSAPAPKRRESVSSTLASEAPDDAPDSGVSVQLSDYIVLSETGDGDETAQESPEKEK